ncbi:hypothetical protein GCM10022215_27770 [Nocardioides fonticola]|uniref:Uncharacterized protein n=1 Tax=Nocardioides fonticola TaxID=450363 RepID=A0ABP7XNG3_9ACTN
MSLRAARISLAVTTCAALPLLLTTAPRAGAVPTPEEYACEEVAGYAAPIPTSLGATRAPGGADVTVTAAIGSAIDRGTVTGLGGTAPGPSIRYAADPTRVGFGPDARRPRVEFDPDDDSGLCASSGVVAGY